MASEFREGDIIVEHDGEGFHVMKILRADAATSVYHTLIFEPVANAPRIDEIRRLKVLIMHAPIASFPKAKLLGNQPVEEAELEGFYTYLKMTDFRRYLKETGLDAAELIKQAQEAFGEGNALCEQGQFESAQVAYSKAIDLFPLFWEAIDNRGLTYMDLGLFEAAIRDFEQSLAQNPRGFTATFSIGECYFKRGDYPRALENFEQAHQINPDHPVPLEWVEKTKTRLQEVGKRVSL